MKSKKNYKTLVQRLQCQIQVAAQNETEAIERARKEFIRRDLDARLINGSFRVEARRVADGLFMCDVLNNYFVEALSFRDSLLNIIRVLKAATFNVGGVAEVIVVE